MWGTRVQMHILSISSWETARTLGTASLSSNQLAFYLACSFIFYLFIKKSFSYLKKLQKETKTQSLYPVVHSLNGHNSWTFPMLKPRVQNSIKVSLKFGTGLATGLSFTAFCNSIHRHWVGSGESASWNGAQMGCQRHHNVTPTSLHLSSLSASH